MAADVTLPGDFVEFAAWHKASGDIDPVYPVIGCVADHLGLDDDDRVALVLLYVAYYDLPSAVTCWLHGEWGDGGVHGPAERYPTGVERRAHRSVAQLVAHTAHLWDIESSTGLRRWLLDSIDDAADPGDGWRRLLARLTEVHGNGRWAAYKTGEMLAEVCGFPVAPTDAGHAQSSGPRHGLGLLVPDADRITGNGPDAIAALDAITEQVRVELCQATGLDHRVEHVETHLCDWKNVVRGRYYVGHDIDHLLHQMTQPGRHPDAVEAIASARLEVFDHRWLGEVGGWDGVRSDLQRLYLQHGEIRWW